MLPARCARGSVRLLVGASVALALLAQAAPAAADGGDYSDSTFCIAHHELCADSVIPYEGHYIGHDEPSLVFYSDAPNSGNDLSFTVRLPLDPPVFGESCLPGSVVNSQLYETFWFGMAMCDSESAPEATKTCIPDSDANIFDNPDPTAPDYIGNHPGTAYMEMQFYPPGSPFGPDGFHWSAALNIFGASYDQNNGIANNQDCMTRVGLETINPARLTRNGIAVIPAGPLSVSSASSSARRNPGSYFVMNSGDVVSVYMHDTPDGFQVVINDLTTGGSGSMTASVANGFSHVIFDPNASTCTSVPYAFHPMYASSSEHTRVPWTVHSFNVAFAFEVGHSER